MSSRDVLYIDRSARERLARLARNEGLNANVVFARYLQERFLDRLGRTPYRESLILKGGLFLFAHATSTGQRLARPTRDVDLSAKGLSNRPRFIRTVFSEICQVQIRDGVVFDYERIKAEEINPQKEYPGVRVRIPANLAGIKTYIQVDIGFGDVVTPAPEPMTFPVLLEDMPAPQILAYSLETVIAEKFQAMIYLSIATGRFRDFYDIHDLAQHHAFSGELLTDAVRNTFHARATPFDTEPVVFRETYKNDPALTEGWTAYLRTSGLEGAPETFAEVVSSIERLLSPVYEACLRRTSMNGTWSPEQGVWLP